MLTKSVGEWEVWIDFFSENGPVSLIIDARFGLAKWGLWDFCGRKYLFYNYLSRFCSDFPKLFFLAFVFLFTVNGLGTRFALLEWIDLCGTSSRKKHTTCAPPRIGCAEIGSPPPMSQSLIGLIASTPTLFGQWKWVKAHR